jgi:hypothetical protein
VVTLRTAKVFLEAVNAGLPPDKTYKRRAAPMSAQKAIGVSVAMVVVGPPLGDGSILLRSKYLQRYTSTKIKFFGGFSEFLCLR